MTLFDRRTVLLASGLALADRSIPTLARRSAAPQAGQPDGYGAESDIWPSFPSTDPGLVRAVVGAAHTDIDTVRELVTAHPALARAAIDWGFGDWESALGAAAHMGRRDMAELLIDRGARPNIFSAAMMGELDTVRAFVTASPGVQGIPGPHGITLLSHARSGGEPAAAVVDYIEDIGGADPRPATVEMTAEQRQQFAGTYTFGAGTHDSFEVEDSRERLMLKRSGQEFGRRMFAVNDREFFPSGSPAVRIAFDLEGGRATTFRVIDNEVILTARRSS